MKTTPVFDTYWRFAASRQEVFLRQLAGDTFLTDDPILQKYKFTNAYRASDRVSQYLIRRVIYSGSQSHDEIFFRTILFKIFNRIDTWERLEKAIGSINWATFSFEEYAKVLDRHFASGGKLYSAAYIMASAKNSFGYSRKHRNHLRLIELMMKEQLATRLQNAHSMEAAYKMLLTYPSIGQFLAFQYTIDLNYGPLMDFSEDDFVVAGPGALDGIQKCFYDIGKYSPADIIRWMVDNQEDQFERLGISFQDLWGRPLQLVDCQNLFCEVSKYARASHPDIQGVHGRKRIKQLYSPTHEILKIWYPPKWNINCRIPAIYKH